MKKIFIFLIFFANSLCEQNKSLVQENKKCVNKCEDEKRSCLSKISNDASATSACITNYHDCQNKCPLTTQEI
jgi:hypothetical protein